MIINDDLIEISPNRFTNKTGDRVIPKYLRKEFREMFPSIWLAEVERRQAEQAKNREAWEERMRKERAANTSWFIRLFRRLGFA